MPGYFNYGSPQGQIVNLQAPNLSGTNAFELPLRALNQGIRNYIDLGDLNRLNDIEARAKLADQSAGEAYRILSSYNNFDDLSALARDPDSALSKAMAGMRASEARELAKAITDREDFGRTKAFNEMGDTYAEVMSRINQLTTSGKRQEADALRNTLANYIAGQRSAGDYIKSLLGAQEVVDNSRSNRAWQGANTARINQSIAIERQAIKDLAGAIKWRSNYSGLNYKDMVTAALQDYNKGLLTAGEFDQIVNGNVLKPTYAPGQVENNWLNEGFRVIEDYTKKANDKISSSIPGEVPSSTNKQTALNQTDQTSLTQTPLTQTASILLKDASDSDSLSPPVIQSVLLKTDDNDPLQMLNRYAQPQSQQLEPSTPQQQVSQQKEPGTPPPSQTTQTFSREWIPVTPIGSNTKEDTVKNANEYLQRASEADASGESPEQLISFGGVLSDVGKRMGRYWKNVGRSFIGKPSQPAQSTASDTQQINDQGFTQPRWNQLLQLAGNQSLEEFQATHPNTWEAIKQGQDYAQIYHQEEKAYQEQQKAKAINDSTLQVFNNPGKVLNDALKTRGDNLDKAQNILNKSIEVSKDKLKKAFPLGAVLQESFEQGTLDASTNPGTVQQLANEIGPETQELLAWADKYNRAHPDRQIDSRMLVIALQRGKVPKKSFASKVGLSNTYKDKNNHEYSFDLNIAQKTAESLAKSYTSEELLNVISIYKTLQDKKTALDTYFTGVKNITGIMLSPYFVSKGKRLQNIQDFYKGIAYLRYLAEDLGRISSSIQSNPLNLK